VKGRNQVKKKTVRWNRSAGGVGNCRTNSNQALDVSFRISMRSTQKLVRSSLDRKRGNTEGKKRPERDARQEDGELEGEQEHGESQRRNLKTAVKNGADGGKGKDPRS